MKVGTKSEFALIFEEKGTREGLDWLNQDFEKTEDVDESLSNSVEDNFTSSLDCCFRCLDSTRLHTVNLHMYTDVWYRIPC